MAIPMDPNAGLPLLCERCGRPLIDDPDDDPMGDPAGALCGECVREREIDVDVTYADASHGSIDAEIDWWRDP